MSAWLKPFELERFDTGCTIEIEQSPEYFHAHLMLDREFDRQPGDEITVHGPPVTIAFGQRRSERRQATVIRAGWLRRAWTRLTGRLELHELYEVSFSPRRTL